MYFEDLDACTYHSGPLDASEWAVPLRAVGWLEHPHRFGVGVVPAELVSKIQKLVEQTREHFPHDTFRGSHDCSLCRAAGRVGGGAGSWQVNLIVPGRHEVYAAPGGIVHYISDHSYLPPAAFLEAVASCADCGSEEYFEALRRANGGLESPVQSHQQFTLEFRESAEKHQAFRRALGVPVMQATRAQVFAAARAIWPEASFSDENESIELGDVRVTFDERGRVVDVAPTMFRRRATQ